MNKLAIGREHTSWWVRKSQLPKIRTNKGGLYKFHYPKQIVYLLNNLFMQYLNITLHNLTHFFVMLLWHNNISTARPLQFATLRINNRPHVYSFQELILCLHTICNNIYTLLICLLSNNYCFHMYES